MAKSAPVKYEVRWRETGTVQWGPISSIDPTAEIVVEGLDRTKTYDFEVRAVSSCGARSAWTSGAHPVSSEPTPPSLDTVTAQSLADGVHLSWSTADTPPAGIEYSVERSVDSGVTWTERARVRTTSYTDPETSGTNYQYRVRAVSYAGSYGAYSTAVTSAGLPVAPIKATADAAKPAFVIDPNFTQGITHWPSDYGNDGWYGEAAGNSPNGAIPTYAVHAGSTEPENTGAHPTTALNNLGLYPANEGDAFEFSCQIKPVGSPDGKANARITWNTSAGGEISVVEGNDITAATGAGTSRVSVRAPAGVAYARAEVACYAHTVGYYTFTGGKDGGSLSAALTFDDANATRTASVQDNGQVVRGTNASGLAITVNSDATAGWAPGTELYALQGAAGAVSFVAGSGVTFDPSDSAQTRDQGSLIGLKWISANTWEPIGDLAYTAPATSIEANATGSTAQPTWLQFTADGQVPVRRGGVLVTDKLKASETTVTPAGSITAADVQTALEDLDTSKATVAGSETFAVAGGTADALTAAFTPAITALTDGEQIKVRAASANTSTTPTLAVDSLAALTITKNGNQPLAAGDIKGAGHELMLRYVAATTPRFELLNPASSSGGGGGGVSSVVAGAGIAVDNTDPANPVVSATSPGSGIGAHRYWRFSNMLPSQLKILGALTAPSACEFRLRSSPGGANLAPTSSSASVTYAGTAVSNLYDGNTSTNWSSDQAYGSFNHWLIFDLGSAKAVQEVYVQARNDTTYCAQTPNIFNVQYSDDAVKWIDVCVVTMPAFTSALQAQTASLPA